MEAEELRLKAAAFGLRGMAYPTVKAALKAAQKTASRGDMILVAGSVFVVAELL
jgi:dihydrofolate synthase/folylpolyglutamate synthase